MPKDYRRLEKATSLVGIFFMLAPWANARVLSTKDIQAIKNCGLTLRSFKGLSSPRQDKILSGDCDSSPTFFIRKTANNAPRHDQDLKEASHHVHNLLEKVKTAFDNPSSSDGRIAASSLNETIGKVISISAVKARFSQASLSHAPPNQTPSSSNSQPKAQKPKPSAKPSTKPKAPKPRFIPIPGSDWEKAANGDLSPEDDPGYESEITFNDQMMNQDNQVGDTSKACRKLDMHGAGAYWLGDLGISGSLHRAILALPYANGRLAVLDSYTPAPEYHYGFVPTTISGAPLTLTLGMNTSLNTTVIRPLPLNQASACNSLLRIFNPLDAKTVFPLKAKRIEKMEIGEIWKLPVQIQIAAGPGLTPIFGPAIVGLNLLYSQTGGYGLTLRRLDKTHLRVRLRFNHAKLLNASGQTLFSMAGPMLSAIFSQEVPVVGDSLGGRNAGQGLSQLWITQLINYTTTKLGASISWSGENQALIEFILNPENPKQMLELQKLATGGRFGTLSTLMKMYTDSAKNSFKLTEKSVIQNAVENGKKLNSPVNFLGTQESVGISRSFNFTIPIILNFSAQSSHDHQQMKIFDPAGGTFKVSGTFKAFDSSHGNQNGELSLPYFGSLFEQDFQEGVSTFLYYDKKGRASHPVILYTQNSGLTRNGKAPERLTKLARSFFPSYGDKKLALPLDGLIPKGEKDSYKGGSSAMTVVLDRNAISDIRRAPKDLIFKSYLNAQDNRQELLALTAVAAKRRTTPEALLDREIRSLYPPGKPSPEKTRRISYLHAEREQFEQMRNLAAELPYLGNPNKKSKTNLDDEAQNIRNFITGKSKNGLAYGDLMKVLVRLIKPKHLAVEFVLSAKRKGGARDQTRLYLNHKLVENRLIKRWSLAASRYLVLQTTD